MKKNILAISLITIGLVGFNYKDELKTMGLHFVAPTIFDKANVHDPEAGEIVYDSKDSKFFGRDHSGSWITLSAGESIMPSGVILPFGGSEAPNGFAICDGRELSREDYSDLFNAIGTSFGAGNGSTTFNIPDMRGRFMRGVDTVGTIDADGNSRTAMAAGGNTGRAVGSIQSDAFQGHSHSYRSYGTTFGIANSYADGSATGFMQSTAAASSFTSKMEGPTTFGSFGAPKASTETRPANAYVNYIIKL